MNVIKTFIVVTLLIFFTVDTVVAIEISQPLEGQKFQTGSSVRVVVKPQTGEKWLGVSMGFDSLAYDSILAAYVGEFPIPNDEDLGEHELVVSALSETKQTVELKRKIIVVLPPSVVLQEIKASPNPLYLEKLPLESDLEDIKAYGMRNLRVAGIYSDGIKREITFSNGTTYTSSNENVVTVSPEGTTTVQGIGTAKITVRNGNHSVDIKVIVDPYKPL